MSSRSQSIPRSRLSPVTALEPNIDQWCVLRFSRCNACMHNSSHCNITSFIQTKLTTRRPAECCVDAQQLDSAYQGSCGLSTWKSASVPPRGGLWAVSLFWLAESDAGDMGSYLLGVVGLVLGSGLGGRCLPCRVNIYKRWSGTR